MKAKKGFMFDFLAPEVKLNIMGRSAVQTKLGMFLSGVCIFLFLTVTTVIVRSYFDTTKPKISQEVKPLNEEPLIDFVKDKHFPMILFYFKAVNPVNSTDLQYFINAFMHRRVWYEAEFVGGLETVEEEIYDIVPCADLINRGKRDTYTFESDDPKVKETWDKLAYCFDNKNYNAKMGGPRGKKTYEMIQLKFYPCVHGSLCRTANDVSKLSFSVTNPTAVSNFGIKNNPISYEFPENYEFLNFDSIAIQKKNLMRAEIYDDRGFLWPNKITSQYTVLKSQKFEFRSRERTQTNCTQTQMDSNKCAAYYIQEFSVSKSRLEIQREYKGVVESLSEIGGIIDLILLVLRWIYGFYNSWVSQGLLVQYIYHLQKPTKVKDKASNKSKENKKAGESKANEKYNKAVEDISNRSIDITEIAKEINRVKFLFDFLFTSESSSKIPNILLKSPSDYIHEEESRPIGYSNSISKPTSLFSPSASPFTKLSRTLKKVKPKALQISNLQEVGREGKLSDLNNKIDCINGEDCIDIEHHDDQQIPRPIESDIFTNQRPKSSHNKQALINNIEKRQNSESYTLLKQLRTELKRLVDELSMD